MPEEDLITAPPTDVAAKLQALASALDGVVPVKQLDRNLLVATWNLRAFGGLTKKWASGLDDSPKRNFADVIYIAEIVSRFDVVAVQEVRGDLRALRYLLKVLGPDWGLISTDTTETREGNRERLAFLYDSRRTKPSGLAGEFAEPFAEDYTVRRTIFDDPEKHHHYDQIAWFTDPRLGPALSLANLGAGTFDFVPELQGELAKTDLSWRISDRYPLWTEFSVREVPA